MTAYIAARQAFRALGGESVVPISTNFRSRSRILGYVNERFQAVLSAPGQPGFKALDPFLPDIEGRHAVAALDVDLGDSTKADQRRDAEAEAVAQTCARMIGKAEIVDRKDGKPRPCRPGDIALLAPQGTDLWRYEAALERYGIPVATQAGKGLFKRQEIQDLIALTRALADGRDTLAFGALFRGPLVGLTDEQLLDLVWGLPRSSDPPNGMGALNVFMPLDAISDGYVRDVVEKLQTLRRRANSTTPHDLLSQAIDLLRLRPILVRRHRGQAERCAVERRPLSELGAGLFGAGTSGVLRSDDCGVDRRSQGSRRTSRCSGRGRRALFNSRVEGTRMACRCPGEHDDRTQGA